MAANRIKPQKELLGKNMRTLLASSCLIVASLAFAGCEDPTHPNATSQTDASKKRIADLSKEQESVKYELSLRRQELADMEASAKRPGIVGVSSEWLRRRDDLKEKIIKLEVRLHEIEYELSKRPSD